MSGIPQLRGTLTDLTFASGDSTLAAGTYAVSSAIDTTTLGSGSIAAQDAEVAISAGVSSSATAASTIAIGILTSQDGITWSDGPADGSTDTTHDANIAWLRPINVPSAAAATLVSLAQQITEALGARVVSHLKIVVYNGSGAALTSLSGTIQGINDSGS